MSTSPITLTLDVSRFPIVVSRLPSHTPTGEELDAHFDEWRALFARNERYVSIVDLSGAQSSSAQMRKKSSAFIKENEATTKRLCVGTAFVVSSPFMRGVLTAIFWVSPPVEEYILVPGLDEALIWARARLQVSGLLPR